ncbi:MAG: hypothetical protein JEY91_14325 [Spirochaetaceae bacterium]|nr:hypothetical protein [Spirochaetaceae bacterium]
MKYTIFILFLFSVSLSAQDYFYSNSLAMEMERISDIQNISKDDIEWLLEKIIEGEKVKTVLFNYGVEYQSSIRTPLSYSEYSEGVLVQEIKYFVDGRISNIISYNSNGTVHRNEIYEYSEDNKLLGIKTVDGSGETEESMEYRFREDGSLRTVFKYGDDKITHMENWNSFNNSLFMEQSIKGSLRDQRYFNEDGLIEKVQRYNGEDFIYEEVYTYYDNGIIQTITRSDYHRGTVIVESMNIQGQMIKEDAFKKDLLLYSSTYFYTGSELTGKEKRSSNLLEKWVYYNNDDERTGEDYYRQGLLEHKKRITDSETNSYTMELYNKGSVFMRLTYEDDVKIREEFLNEGKVTRTRELGEV